MKKIDIIPGSGSFAEDYMKFNSRENAGVDIVVTVDDVFARTGIVLAGTGASVDVVNENGEHLFRLNFAISPTNISVDVIPAVSSKERPSDNPRQDPYLRILAWNQGVKLVDCLSPMVCAKLE